MKKSLAAWLASQPEAQAAAFLDQLSGNALAALPYLWEVWAHPQHQIPPEGPWTTWVILGGRGAGKTRAGAEWVRSQVEGARPRDPGRARRLALLGETIDQARAVMVEGDSGILACSPPDRRPEWKASEHKLIWPNGAEAMVVSAANPEALRGPQFDGAWCDELAKWRRCRDAWDMLQFCLRLGQNPRQLVTTTPRDNPVLVEILEAAGTVVTHAATEANRANLAGGFVERLAARYAGTALGRQELAGELIRGRTGALWTRGLIKTGGRVPNFVRVVVAVDPPAGSSATSDECGIVVAGLAAGSPCTVWVLADLSVQGQSPQGWAEIAAEAYHRFEADRLVAEVNQGGDMVESIMRQVAPQISYRAVRATRGKRLRAEPVAALYEQGRVWHASPMPELEDQMCSFVANAAGGGKSPDRLDALVWALTDLVLLGDSTPDPRVRRL